MQNNFIKIVYIHAGFHKTGTSSIQATCAKNFSLLSLNSIYYPTKMAINHSEFIVPMFMKNPDDYYLEKSKNLSKETIVKEYREKKELFTKELLQIKEEKLLISGEDIWGMEENELLNMQLFLKQTFPNALIKIILCTRNPSEYISSGLPQAVQTGFMLIPPYEFKMIPFIWATKRIASIFNIDNLMIYDFEGAKKHNLGLVGYFLENVLQIKNLGTSNIKILRDNDSITNLAVHIIKYINISTSSSLFDKGEDGGMLKYERYLNDTQALWSLKGDKFKLDKEYVKELYKKLEPELKWLKENFNIDYNIENVTYTEERYKIPDNFFETIKKTSVKLSRIVRRSFYEWLCKEIQTRKGDEFKELEKTKLSIEKNYKALVSISLDDLKKQINQEIEACQNFFSSFSIKNKQSYQPYYHLYLLLKEIGEHKAFNTMLQHFYQKNSDWNDKWEVPLKILMAIIYQVIFCVFNKTKKLSKAIETFKNTFESKIV